MREVEVDLLRGHAAVLEHVLDGVAHDGDGPAKNGSAIHVHVVQPGGDHLLHGLSRRGVRHRSARWHFRTQPRPRTRLSKHYGRHFERADDGTAANPWAWYGAKPQREALESLRQHLEHKEGLMTDFAQWVVETWAGALGVDAASDSDCCPPCLLP